MVSVSPRTLFRVSSRVSFGSRCDSTSDVLNCAATTFISGRRQAWHLHVMVHEEGWGGWCIPRTRGAVWKEEEEGRKGRDSGGRMLENMSGGGSGKESSRMERGEGIEDAAGRERKAVIRVLEGGCSRCAGPLRGRGRAYKRGRRLPPLRPLRGMECLPTAF